MVQSGGERGRPSASDWSCPVRLSAHPLGRKPHRARNGSAFMSEWDAKTAEWYAEKYGEYATNTLAIDALDGITPSYVLDIGCGTGAALRHASIRWTSARFIGVDPVPRMVEIAEERLVGHPRMQSVEFRVGAAEKIPVADCSIDLVLAFDSMDHWSNVDAGASEVARVLIRGGHLVVVKDQGVPGDRDRVVKLFSAEDKLELECCQQIQNEDISFTMWVFAATGTQK